MVVLHLAITLLVTTTFVLIADAIDIVNPTRLFLNDHGDGGAWTYAAVRWSPAHNRPLEVNLFDDSRGVAVADFGVASSEATELVSVVAVSVTSADRLFNLTLVDRGKVVASRLTPVVWIASRSVTQTDDGLIDSCRTVHGLGVQASWQRFPASPVPVTDFDYDAEKELLGSLETRLALYLIEDPGNGMTISLHDSTLISPDWNFVENARGLFNFEFLSFDSTKNYSLMAVTTGSRRVVALTRATLREADNYRMATIDLKASLVRYASVITLNLTSLVDLTAGSFDVDMCWANGMNQLALLSAKYTAVSDAIYARLPEFAENDPSTVYIRVSLRKVGQPDAVGYPGYVSDRYRVLELNVSALINVHHVRIIGTNMCLVRKDLKRATFELCITEPERMTNQVFSLVDNNKIYLAHAGRCLTRPDDDGDATEFSICRNKVDTFTAWIFTSLANRCGDKFCRTIEIPPTQPNERECVRFNETSGNLDSITPCVNPSPVLSPLFSSTGHHIASSKGVNQCLTYNSSHKFMVVSCEEFSEEQKFTYDFESRNLSSLSGNCVNNDECGGSALFYEALTKQIVFDDGKCLRVRDDLSSILNDCLDTNDESKVPLQRHHSFAFYGEKKNVRMWSPGPERNPWFVDGKTIRGVITWDASTLSPNRKVRILLVRLSESGNGVLSRLVIQIPATNTGFVVFEILPPVPSFVSLGPYVFELTIPGEPPALTEPFDIKTLESALTFTGPVTEEDAFVLMYSNRSGIISATEPVTWSAPLRNESADLFVHVSFDGTAPTWTGGGTTRASIAHWMGLTKPLAGSHGVIRDRIARPRECDCVLLATDFLLSQSSIEIEDQVIDLGGVVFSSNDNATYYLVLASRDIMQYEARRVTLEVVDDDKDAPIKSVSTALIAGVTVGVIVVVVLLILLIVVFVKRKRRRKSEEITKAPVGPPTPLPRPHNLDMFRGESLEMNRTSVSTISPSKRYIEMRDISYFIDGDNIVAAAKLILPSDLELGKMLGTGEFGEVCQGVWKTTTESGEPLFIDVAVKTLKQAADDQVKSDLLKEASVMASYNHPHLVALMGVCLENPTRLVTELARHGALDTYLKQRRPDVSVKDVVGLEQQLKFAGQIASAMLYLEESKLVHRDLAARNVMVFSYELVKVADFGLSRVLDGGRQYYVSSVSSKAKVALRWMAPECWNTFKFTTMSDVWSFGVTLWEIMSYAVSAPYVGVSNVDVIVLVEAGKRLPKPERCPDSVYDIMKLCWTYDPKERITFSELKEKLWDGTVFYLSAPVSSGGPVLIPKESLDIRRELGSGAFGTVNEAAWKSPNGFVDVAVKKIKNASSSVQDALLAEASVMTSLTHVNIVQFLGISLPQSTASKSESDNIVMLVSELVPLGALNSYVQKTLLSNSVLLNFANQIAVGMSYLAGQRIIHRDLAARNVLVSTPDLVKVSDFGMSKALGLSKEFYSFAKEEKVPIKWMSPEALLYGKFSTKSDVWSYGVTLWEIWSQGAIPWSGIAKKDLVGLIESGSRLEHPRNMYSEKICSDEVYSLMLECWKFKPENRPDFDHFTTRTKEILQPEDHDQKEMLGAENHVQKEMLGSEDHDQVFDTSEVIIV